MVDRVNFTGSVGHKVAIGTQKTYNSLKKYNTEKALKAELYNLMPNSAKQMDKLKACNGEVPNILINAVGTGAVAPIFIKWNPMSKTDEDTRTYSALRQPVSAITSIVTQVSLVAPINAYVNNKSNSGNFGEKYNKSALQDEAYIAKLIKKANPSFTKKQVKEAANIERMNQLEHLIDYAKANDTIEYYQDGKKVKISSEEFRELLQETLDSKIKTAEKNVVRYNTVKPTKQIARADYLRTNSEHASQVFNNILDGITENTDHKSAKNIVKSALKDEAKLGAEHKELTTMLKEILVQPDLTTLKTKTQLLIEKTKESAKFTSLEELTNNINKKIAGSIKSENNEIKILKELKEDVKNGKKIKELAAKASKVRDLDLAYDTVSTYTEKIGKHIKGLKQVMGLCVSLAILPVSCSLLNWCYPKIMDALFPKLSNSKHDNEKDKFVKQCDNKVEVNK